jgi:hypothetical protein
MFLRCKVRRKDGKQHRYWSVVENTCVGGGRVHREWFQRSALADLLGEDAGLAGIHKLYRCHDRLLVYKQAVFDHLVERWRDLFNISYDVLLYALSHQVKRCLQGSPQFVHITCCCESGELDFLGQREMEPSGSWSRDRQTVMGGGTGSRNGSGSVGEPKVRIHLPPAASPVRTRLSACDAVPIRQPSRLTTARRQAAGPGSHLRAGAVER